MMPFARKVTTAWGKMPIPVSLVLTVRWERLRVWTARRAITALRERQNPLFAQAASTVLPRQSLARYARREVIVPKARLLPLFVLLHNTQPVNRRHASSALKVTSVLKTR